MPFASAAGCRPGMIPLCRGVHRCAPIERRFHTKASQGRGNSDQASPSTLRPAQVNPLPAAQEPVLEPQIPIVRADRNAEPKPLAVFSPEARPTPVGRGKAPLAPGAGRRPSNLHNKKLSLCRANVACGGVRSHSRWPRLPSPMTCSPTSCAALTGSDRSQPGHDGRATGPCVLGGVAVGNRLSR